MYTLECGHTLDIDRAIFIAIAEADAGGNHCLECGIIISCRDSCYLIYGHIKSGETKEQYEKRQEREDIEYFKNAKKINEHLRIALN